MTLSPSELAAATKAIENNQRILIVPHANVDPDALSSALACFRLFSELGKEVTVVCPDTLPESLNFLPGFEKISSELEASQKFVVTVNLDFGVEVDKLRYTVEDNKVNIVVMPKKGKISAENIVLSEGEAQFDLIVVVDTADLSLLGTFYTDHIDLFSQVPILNVDHHISNTGFGQLQLIDPTSASATEVLYHWFMHVPAWKEKIDSDLSTLLLTGLITDTRSFQNPNTTPRSLEVAAELLGLGAAQQEIIQSIYKTKPLSTLKIWGRALNRIQIDSEARIVWSTVSKEDLAEMGATSKETSGILDELISTVPDADVYVLFTEVEEGGLKASARSSTAIDISRLAAEEFGGGGHPRAAGFRTSNYENFQLEVLECIRKLKEGMMRQKKKDGEIDHEEHAQVRTIKPTRKNHAKIQIPAEPEKAPEKEVDIVQELADEDSSGGGMDVVDELNRA